MSNLIKHAEYELQKAGFFDKDSDYEGLVGPAVLEIVKVFAEQGHSGFSAGLVTSLLGKLMRFEPLGPLTGTDDEWVEVTEGIFQNRRCSHVFKTAEHGAYDIDGKIFRYPNGGCYTNKDSRVPVTFPYTPKREYVDVPAEEVAP